jgi:hypothetical protein
VRDVFLGMGRVIGDSLTRPCENKEKPPRTRMLLVDRVFSVLASQERETGDDRVFQAHLSGDRYFLFVSQGEYLL